MSAELMGVEEQLARFAVDAARRFRVVAALKGPTTYVADPHGRCFAHSGGRLELATSGSRDILTGIVREISEEIPRHPRLEVALRLCALVRDHQCPRMTLMVIRRERIVHSQVSAVSAQRTTIFAWDLHRLAGNPENLSHELSVPRKTARYPGLPQRLPLRNDDLD